MKKVLYISIISLFLIVLCVGVVMIIEKNSNTRSSQEESNDSNYNKEQYRSLEKISIEIQKNTISSKGVTLIITDDNEKDFPWSNGYKIQKKITEKWTEIEPKNELITEAFSHWKDENNQYKQKINWSYYYGELENGQYRIVKPIYNPENNSYLDLYSDEFQINEE